MSTFWKFVLGITCVALIGNGVLLYRKNGMTAAKNGAEKKYTRDITHRVSRAYATECITAYRKITGDTILNYFTISRQDFLQAIQIDTSLAPIESIYNYVRGYIGYDTAAKKMHIFFTPVQNVTDNHGKIINAGTVVYLSGRYNIIDRQSGAAIPGNLGDKNGEGEYLLDLNAPCPTTCNPEGDGITVKK